MKPLTYILDSFAQNYKNIWKLQNQKQEFKKQSKNSAATRNKKKYFTSLDSVHRDIQSIH